MHLSRRSAEPLRAATAIAPCRPLVVSLVALALAACSPDAARNPVAPFSPNFSHAGAEVPFGGSFTSATSGQFVPPATLVITGAMEGTATQLGRFTATSVDIVNANDGTSIGTVTFTAANGDQLFTTTAGGEDGFTPPNISHVTLVATIVGGTGRFAGATGTFTIQQTSTIDFASGTATVSGSFDGTIARH